MVHINATITFDKNDDAERFEVFQSCLFTYNMMANISGAQVLRSEQVDCGDTVEIRLDQDFDTSNFDKFENMIKFADTLTNCTVE